jgi:hypothetical protein
MNKSNENGEDIEFSRDENRNSNINLGKEVL